MIVDKFVGVFVDTKIEASKIDVDDVFVDDV